MKKRLSIFIFIFFALSNILSGCNKGSGQAPPPQPQSSEESAKSKKVPDELKKMEKSIEEIITTISGEQLAEQKPQDSKQAGQSSGTKSGNQGQGGESQGTSKEGSSKEEASKDGSSKEDSSKEGASKEGASKEGASKEGASKDSGSKDASPKGGEGKSEQASGEQGKQDKPEQVQDIWVKVKKTVDDLHLQWNTYMTKAVKDNGGKDSIEHFSAALNATTNAALSKNKNSTIAAANNMYYDLLEFYRLYDVKTSPDIKKIKFYTRSIMLNGMTGNWSLADENMVNLLSTWSLVRTTLSKDQKENEDKLAFSIIDLEKVEKEKNEALTNIKGKITLTNIDNIEKVSENKQQ